MSGPAKYRVPAGRFEDKSGQDTENLDNILEEKTKYKTPLSTRKKKQKQRKRRSVNLSPSTKYREAYGIHFPLYAKS